MVSQMSDTAELKRLFTAHRTLESATALCDSAAEQKPGLLRGEIRTVLGTKLIDNAIMPTLMEEGDSDDDVDEIVFEAEGML